MTNTACAMAIFLIGLLAVRYTVCTTKYIVFVTVISTQGHRVWTNPMCHGLKSVMEFDKKQPAAVEPFIIDDK